MKISKLFISITVFLFCNLGCEDSDSDSFSIIGTWKYYWKTSESTTNWTTANNMTFQLQSLINEK